LLKCYNVGTIKNNVDEATGSQKVGTDACLLLRCISSRLISDLNS